MSEETGVGRWVESHEETETRKGKTSKMDEGFFMDESDSYEEGGSSLFPKEKFREGSSMGEELLEEEDVEKLAMDSTSISPSRVKTEFRTDYKSKSKFRTKDESSFKDLEKKKRPRKAVSLKRKSVKQGEIITDDEGQEWTVVEKTEDGKVQVRNRNTGEETYLDEEYLTSEASIYKKAEENLIDVEEEIEEKEEGDEKEKEPDVSIEKEKEEKGKKEKREKDITIGKGIYGEYLIDVITDPEIAPLVLEKLLRKFEDEDEILAKLESLLVEGDIESDEYWEKNASAIGKGIMDLIEKLGKKECYAILLYDGKDYYRGGYTCDKEETLEYYKSEEGYYEEGEGIPCIVFRPYETEESEEELLSKLDSVSSDGKN